MAPTYQVMPFPKFFAVDENGAPYAAGLVDFFEAGGLSTRLDTYSDSTGTANANPVVLDSAGRATIYLANKAYAVRLRSAAGATIWTVDPVYGFALASDYGLCGGRLTLTSGTPITTSDVTAAGTVYFTPYTGSQIALFDGTSVWGAFAFTELSIAVPAVANQMYDVFIYNNAGTPALELTAWTNDTTRATAITLQNGVYVKSGTTTRRYLGSFRTISASQTEDSFANRNLCNWLNAEQRPMRAIESTDNWGYNTTTWRQANASATNQVACVAGIPGRVVVTAVHALVRNDTAGNRCPNAIGKDSTTAPATGLIFVSNYVPVANYVVSNLATLSDIPAVGYHFYAWLEQGGASGNTTFLGDNGTPTLSQSGMQGWMWG